MMRLAKRAIAVNRFALLLAAACFATNAVPADEQGPRMRIELAVREDGTATENWTTGTAISIGRDRAERLAGESMPLTSGGEAWLAVLERARPDALKRAARLVETLGVSPLDVTVVVGNRGSSDGFGWVPDFIGINVDAFARAYGPPDDEAEDRMARIVAHEYLHLVTYASYPNHRELRQTPLDRALWTLFFEGIGDYVSISERWLPDEQGDYSPVAARTLAQLEPILVNRLERLFTADEQVEQELRAGIAMGKFDEKWGSLPFALWLHSESRRCDEEATLRAAFRLERGSVLPLARKYIDATLRPRIVRLQELTAGRYGGSAAGATRCIADDRQAMDRREPGSAGRKAVD